MKQEENMFLKLNRLHDDLIQTHISNHIPPTADEAPDQTGSSSSSLTDDLSNHKQTVKPEEFLHNVLQTSDGTAGAELGFRSANISQSQRKIFVFLDPWPWLKDFKVKKDLKTSYVYFNSIYKFTNF